MKQVSLAVALRRLKKHIGPSFDVDAARKAVLGEKVKPVKLSKSIIHRIEELLAQDRRVVVAKGRVIRVFTWKGYKSAQTGMLRARTFKKPVAPKPLIPALNADTSAGNV